VVAAASGLHARQPLVALLETGVPTQGGGAQNDRACIARPLTSMVSVVSLNRLDRRKHVRAMPPFPRLPA
jgi:hypothetical protein